MNLILYATSKAVPSNDFAARARITCAMISDVCGAGIIYLSSAFAGVLCASELRRSKAAWRHRLRHASTDSYTEVTDLFQCLVR